MDVKDAIKARRSIRRFKEEEIPNDVITELTEAANLAPSGTNAQPTRLFFIRNENLKQKLEEEGAFDQDFVHKAPLIIIFCGDPSSYKTANFTKLLIGREEKRTLRDVTIASSFVVLRATELGLSTCWVGLIKPEVIKKVLDIPEDYMIPFVLCVGKPDEKPGPRIRKSADEIVLGNN